MKTQNARLLAASGLFCALGSVTALAASWLGGPDTGSDACRQAQTVAIAKFDSPESSMSGPISLTKDSPVHFALQVKDEDISGGDALTADATIFSDQATHKDGDPVRHVFWQTAPRGEKRIVVVDSAFNWEGDWYSFYALDPTTKPQALLDDLREDNASKRNFKPLVDGSWVPPQVLIDNQSGDGWVLTQGATLETMSAWTVYAAKDSAFAARCTVHFIQPSRDATPILSAAGRRFAAILIEMRGSGADEGTLHTTARIALGVDSDWHTILARPWALNNLPYNSRAEVDEDLKQWAAVNRKRLAVYNDMLRQYPRAQEALAAYYGRHFHAKPGQAVAMARYAMDVVLRDNFVFNSSMSLADRMNAQRTAKARAASPWPAPPQR